MRQNYSTIVHNDYVVAIGQVLGWVSDQESSFVFQKSILSKNLVENGATHVSINSAVVKGCLSHRSDFTTNPKIGQTFSSSKMRAHLEKKICVGHPDT